HPSFRSVGSQGARDLVAGRRQPPCVLSDAFGSAQRERVGFRLLHLSVWRAIASQRRGGGATRTAGARRACCAHCKSNCIVMQIAASQGRRGTPCFDGGSPPKSPRTEKGRPRGGRRAGGPRPRRRGGRPRGGGVAPGARRRRGLAEGLVAARWGPLVEQGPTVPAFL
ncbi:unnamed protein product, partial [Prorocentrum cordatum]